MRKKALFWCNFVLFIITSGVYSQDTAAYLPGVLYLKYKDHVATRSFIPSVYDKVKIEDVPQLSPIKDEFRIFQVRKPFYLAGNNVKLQNTYEIKFSEYEKADELIKELQSDPAIEYAEKIPVIEFDYEEEKKTTNTAYIPNDPLYSRQWHLSHIKCPEAWEITKGDPNVVVAIVDGWVDPGHKDLRMWNNPGEIPNNGIDDDGNGKVDDVVGWNFVRNRNDPGPATISNTGHIHGTHVAGCAAAQTDNGLLVASPAYNVSVMGLAVETNANAALEAILYAAKEGARVINNSWGSPTDLGQTAQSVILEANDLGAAVFASAGNEGRNNIRYPCSYNGVICVSNLNNHDQKVSTSSYHSTVDIGAPGIQILSTSAGGDGTETYTMSGTSQATPVTVGVAALMLSVSPDLTPAEIEDCLKSTAVEIYDIPENQPYIGKLGAGRVDALAAVECALERGSGVPVAGFSVNTTSGCGSLTVEFTDGSRLSPSFWLWNFGDGTTSTEQNPVHAYSAPGNYTVTLKVGNENGENQIEKTDVITVEPGRAYPAQKVGEQHKDIGTGGYAGGGRFMIFDALEDMTLVSIKVYPETTGDIQLAITKNQGGAQIYSTTTFKVTAPEDRVTLNWDLPAGAGYELSLMPSTPVNLYRNQSGATYPHNIDNLISIHSNYWAEQGNPKEGWYVGYDWEVKRMGCYLQTGIVDKAKEDLKIYPNPVNDILNTKLTADKLIRVEVKLYNMIGGLVYEKNISSVKGTIVCQLDLSDLASGNYLFYMNTGDKIYSQKVVKE